MDALHGDSQSQIPVAPISVANKHEAPTLQRHSSQEQIQNIQGAAAGSTSGITEAGGAHADAARSYSKVLRLLEEYVEQPKFRLFLTASDQPIGDLQTYCVANGKSMQEVERINGELIDLMNEISALQESNEALEIKGISHPDQLTSTEEADLNKYNEKMADLIGRRTELFASVPDNWVPNPVCGQVANMMWKLLCDGSRPSDPVALRVTQGRPGSAFRTAVAEMNPEDAFVVRVSDKALGHDYCVIGLPVAPGGSPADREFKIVQSNLGGALRALPLATWLRQRGNESFSLGEIEKLVSGGYRNGAPAERARFLAHMLDAYQDPKGVVEGSIKLDKESSFIMQRFRPEDVSENISRIKESAGEVPVTPDPANLTAFTSASLEYWMRRSPRE